MSLLPALLAVLLASLPARAADHLTVYDRSGAAFTVYNVFDGENYSIRITQHDRAGRLLREQVNADGFQKQAVALDIDDEGNLYVAGVRYWQGAQHLWAMKYYASANWSWEWADQSPSCWSSEVAANHAGDAWVAGACREGEDYSLRLVRLEQRGAAAWSQRFPTGTRCHVRNLSVDDGDRASVTALLGGHDRSAGGAIQTVVYDGYGRQLALY